MADLPNTSFVAVNDIEVASDTPITEALLNKVGSNENYLENQKTLTNARVSALEALPIVKSASSGGFIGTNITYATVTNLTATITPTFGRVLISLESDGSGSIHGIQNNTDGFFMRILRNSTVIFEILINRSLDHLDTNLFYTDTAAGTSSVTYSVQAKHGGFSAVDYRITNMSLVARAI